MSKHEVKITAFTEREADHFSQIPKKTLGGITVKPPISTGRSFREAVLGLDKSEVGLSFVASTSEVSVFVAETSRGTTSEERQGVIHNIADRIKQFADAPEKVIEMMDENPFPEPQEEW